MSSIFEFCDELGPEKIIHVYEPSVNLKAILVIDNVAKGPAIGGMRMAEDVSVEECVRLARAMTFKNAAAGLPHGGGKIVIYGDPKMPKPQKAQILRALCNNLRNVDDYIFAPDMGTDEECMAWIRDEVGRVVGLPREIGGIPLDEIGATGFGLAQATEVATQFMNMDLKGARVVVQGFGAVGKNATRFLIEKGAKIVAVADSRGAIENQDGLDLQGLLELKSHGKCVDEYSDGTSMASDDVIGVDCEIWIPAARPDVIHEDNVDQIRAKIIVEGANIPATHEAERMLHERGVLVVPDFIANAGGVICAAMEYHGSSESAAMQTIAEKVRRNTEQVLNTAKEENILPREAAMALASKRVRKAMSFRRFSLFSTAPGFV
ncbi:MAG: Glu/Leu/Phe/Val dehydrogenase [Gammaproteobacteria bacterium]|nr:Glu/Leu/Phe/Val dehydrogenase [Gammaproteobacteria bacterium]